MSAKLRISLAQLNLIVGDVPGNTERMVATIESARAAGNIDLVVFQELALCGYPPEDLLFHSGLRHRVEQGIARLCEVTSDLAILVGFPEYIDDKIYNSAAWIEDGAVRAVYRKQCLPNYGVFDERRYFTPGTDEYRRFAATLGWHGCTR